MSQPEPPVEQWADEDDEGASRTAWLLTLTPDRIAQYDRTTICDWLIARNEQRQVRLAAACQALREECAIRERARARLAAALTAAP